MTESKFCVHHPGGRQMQPTGMCCHSIMIVSHEESWLEEVGQSKFLGPGMVCCEQATRPSPSSSPKRVEKVSYPTTEKRSIVGGSVIPASVKSITKGSTKVQDSHAANLGRQR